MQLRPELPLNKKNTTMLRSLAGIIIVVLCSFSRLTASSAPEWHELGKDHFIVYFTQDEEFAKEVLDKAELYYVRIASDLGYSRYSEFWTWDNRVKIYIYPDHDSYLQVANIPGWSEGLADYKNKRIISYTHGEGFLDGILPHEIAHLIFRDFVGFKGEVPVWLDEGVAQWSEPLKRQMVDIVSKRFLSSRAFFSLADMVNLDIRKVKANSIVKIHSILNKDGKRDFLSLNGDTVVTVYYVEAVSLVGFLVEEYGANSFTDFCRQLRDGKSLEEALKFAYPMDITSLDALENNWLEYLEAN